MHCDLDAGASKMRATTEALPLVCLSCLLANLSVGPKSEQGKVTNACPLHGKSS
jgi:hypothetical protein